MAWLNALLLAIQLAWAEFERNRALSKQMRRDERRGYVNEKPTDANAELFGPSAGRLHIDGRATETTGESVRSDSTQD